MKKALLILALAFTFIVNAQDDSYIPLSDEQQTECIKLSEEKIGSAIKFDSGMNYDGMFFWYMIASDGKEYYFNSSTTFTDLDHEEASYSSLMEYVIEVIGF